MTPRLCTRRLSRATLLCSTALQAAFALAVVTAHAQPAPNARPQGGRVVAGSATIGRAPTNTVVNQSTDRAAIDWRSFDVGKNQTVTFQQPSATSATLNRVTGPDPSAIAGSITANGQVILTNPNGVTFFKGSQVNAQSLVVSAPGITNQNFMAGRMVFDQAAKPNARIENAGTITVKQAGLAALVAPSVANSGTINAHLGHVVLAGAAAHTLDMYGDGLVSIDVTKQVVQTPTGPGGKPVTALVTNTGTIHADGGTIQLTARAADGVVQTLVDAGGTLRADTVGARTGQIEIAGTGGAVIIAGRIAADSRTGQAGTIVLNGSTATRVADSAHVTANGGTGGGTIAVGTTLARARSNGQAPTATSARTAIAAGARLAANATKAGNGGRITVLSTQSTVVAGSLAAKGGISSGNGGSIELSGETGFRLTGTADVTAPHGGVGTILLDPRDLTITSSAPSGTANQQPANLTDPTIAANAGGTTTDAYVTPAQLQALYGNLHLLTTRDLTVASPLTYNSGSVTLEAGRNLTVASTGSISTSNNLSLIAASAAISGYVPTGTLSIAGPISGSGMVLSGGTGGIALAANVTASSAINLSAAGAVIQTAGIVRTPQLYGSASSVSLSDANAVAGVGNGQNASYQTTAGGFLLTNASGSGLTIGTARGGGGLFVPSGQTISLAVDTLSLQAAAGGKAITAPSGTLSIQSASNRPVVLANADNSDGGALFIDTAALPRLSIGTLTLGTTSAITLGNSGETVDLTSNGIGTLTLNNASSITQGGSLRVATLAVATSGNAGSLNLSNTANQIGTASLITGGTTTLTTAGDLVLTAMRGGSTVTVAAGGSITAAGTTAFTASNSIELDAGSNQVPNASATAALTANAPLVASGVYLSANSGGIALNGGVTADFLSIGTSGALTQGAPGIVANRLDGNAGSVRLPSVNNAIDNISAFAVTDTAGDFTLVDHNALFVGGTEGSGGISVQTGRTINLATDALTIGSTSDYTLTAPNGLVVIQPYTASTPIFLTASDKPAGTLAISQQELGRVQTSQLILGAINSGTGQRNTGSITLGKPGETIDLSDFDTLGLNTAGAVTQGANGLLVVSALTANVGTLTLANAGNQIGTFFGVSATGDVALHTATALSVGFLETPGNVTLSSGGTGGMTLYGDISGNVVNLTTTANAAPTANDPGISQTGGSLTAATLTGAAGTAQFGRTNAVAAIGDFTTYGSFQLNDAGTALTLAGTLSTTRGTTTLSTAGLTQTDTSRLITPQLSGTATAATTLTARGNAVAAIGYFNQTAGDFTLVSSAPTLNLASGGNLTATAGSFTFVTDGIAIATVERSGTAVSAPNGSITVAPFTAGRPIELIGAGSNATPGTLSIGTAFTSQIAADTLGLGIPGTTSAISIGHPGDAIDLRPVVGRLVLQTTGAVTEPTSASLAVTTLGGIAGSIGLTAATNQIAAVASLSATAGNLAVQTASALTVASASATGSLQLTAAGTLTIGGALSAASIGLTGAGITQSAGAISATDTLTLNAPGAAIAQTGGTITAAVLISRSGFLSLPGADQIAIADIAATGAVSVTDDVSLTLTALSAASAGITTGANLVLAGNVTVTDALALTAGGTITQPGGTLSAGTLSAAASTVTLDRTNAVATLGASTSAGGFTLVDTGDLAVAGPVATGSLALTTTGRLTFSGDVATGTLSGSADSVGYVSGPTYAIDRIGSFATINGFSLSSARPLTVAGPLSDANLGISLSAPAITFAGQVTAPTLSVASPGAVTQTAGTLAVGTLGGSADSLDIGNASPANITTLGRLTVNSTLALTDSGALVVTGPLAAPYLAISAVGSLTLQNGTIRTDGQAFGAQLGATAASPGSSFAVRPDASGLANFIQRGTTTVTGFSTEVPALRVDLPASGGTATLNDLQATEAGIVLALGSGSASGQLNVGQLVLLAANGAASLTGQVAGRTGSAAAEAAQIRPNSDLNYTLNGCIIGGSSCTSTTPTSPTGPVTTPTTPVSTTPSTPTTPTTPTTLPPAGSTPTPASPTTPVATTPTPTITPTPATPGTIPAAALPGTQIGSATAPGYDLPITTVVPPNSLLTTLDPAAAPAVFDPYPTIASILRPDLLSLGVVDLTVTRDRDDPTLLLPNISDRDY